MEKEENIFSKFANKLTQNRFLALNILIIIVVVFCVVIGVVLFFSYQQPKNLQQATGIIAKFEQRDKEWYDYIGSSSGNEFNVTFEDGTYFEATGIAYDNIDRKLFEIICVGEEIKITYDYSWSRPNRIYSIEYKGVNYLMLDNVLTQYRTEHKGSLIEGVIIVVVSVVLGCVGLCIVNYKNKKSLQNR